MLLCERNPNYVIFYYYDAEGSPVAFDYKDLTSSTSSYESYVYVKNLQGDVTEVYDSTGLLLVTYTYDAYGNFTTTYSNGGASTNATKNPFTYRGYYYDKDLSMYYLQSRYYDANTCRFINADGYVSTGQGLLGCHMYAYCGNNPVMYVDPAGELFFTIALSATVVLKASAVVIGVAGIGVFAYFATNGNSKSASVSPSTSFSEIELSNGANSKSKDIDLTLPEISYKTHEHHIVAKADYRAEESRQILADVGIDAASDPRNLVTLPQRYHASLHTTAYHNYVTERLRLVAGDRAGVEATLASLKAEIVFRSVLGIRWD